MEEYLKQLHPRDPIRVILTRDPSISRQTVDILLELTGNDIYRPLLEFVNARELHDDTFDHEEITQIFEEAMHGEDTILNHELFYQSTLVNNEMIPFTELSQKYFEKYHQCATEVVCIGVTFRKLRNIDGKTYIASIPNDVTIGLIYVNQQHSYLKMNYTLSQCHQFGLFNIFIPPKPIQPCSQNVSDVLSYLRRVLENPEPIIKALDTMILKPECDDPTVYYINDMHRSYIGLFFKWFYELYITHPRKRVIVDTPSDNSPYNIVINTKDCNEVYQFVRSLKILEYYSHIIIQESEKIVKKKKTPVRSNIIHWLETNMPMDGVYSIPEMYKMMRNCVSDNVNRNSFNTDITTLCADCRIGRGSYKVCFPELLRKLKEKNF